MYERTKSFAKSAVVRRTGRTILYRLFHLLMALLLAPIAILGASILTVSVIWRTRNSNISLTAYVPLTVRWILHEMGRREDKWTRKLLYHIPGISATILDYSVYPFLFYLRESDIEVSFLSYPVYESRSALRMINHRTTFFDETIHEYRRKVDQLVILGAGWGSRSCWFSSKHDLSVFEVDRREMITAKKKAINSGNLEWDEVTFLNVNLNTECWMESLQKTNFDPGKSTLVVLEGVLPYLDPGIIKDCLQPVADTLAPGSAIVFDFLSEDTTKNSVSQQIAHRFGEPWNWGFDTSGSFRKRIETFLSSQELSLKKFAMHGQYSNDKVPYGGLVLATAE